MMLLLMKKNYLKPSMKVVKMRKRHLLVGSPTEGEGSDYEWGDSDG